MRYEDEDNYKFCDGCKNNVFVNHCGLCPYCSQFMSDEEVEEKCREYRENND